MSNFVNLLDIIYPVNSIYITAGSISPATSIGGTWTQIKDGACLAAYDGIVGYTGSKTISVKQMPAHRHDMNYSLSGTNLALPSNQGNWYVFSSAFGWICPNNPITVTGGGRTTFHTIIQSMYGKGLLKSFEGAGL